MKKSNTCFHCGSSFYPAMSNQMYCCPDCRRASYKKNRDFTVVCPKGMFWDLVQGAAVEICFPKTAYWEKKFKQYFGWAYGPVPGNEDEFGWGFPPVDKDVVFRKYNAENAPQFTATVRICEREEKKPYERGIQGWCYVLVMHHLRDFKNL